MRTREEQVSILNNKHARMEQEALDEHALH